jgi:hypothetical protein
MNNARKNSYLIKNDPRDLIYDDPHYYKDDYEINRIFTRKGHSKLYALIWNAIAWWNYRRPNGVFANMMFLSYRMGVYDERWEQEMVDSLNPENWE